MGASFSSEDPSEQDRNLRFYRNEIKSSPWPGTKIQDMLLWVGKYNKLESNHSYIQWLFPTPEGSGMNPYAQPLREHEAKAIREDELASVHVLMAYKMMLDFYGMKLVDENEGKVVRNENWRDRYKHLNRSTHNYRRITRIIKSLGELGYERFQCPWITFLIEEAVINRELPNLNGPCMKHFIGAIKEVEEKQHMYENYLELIRKPKPGQYSSPKQNIKVDNTTEKRTEFEHYQTDGGEHNDRRVPNGDIDEQRNIGFTNDSQQLKSKDVTATDTDGDVDFGPAANDTHKNMDIPFIDEGTITNGQQTESDKEIGTEI